MSKRLSMMGIALLVIAVIYSACAAPAPAPAAAPEPAQAATEAPAAATTDSTEAAAAAPAAQTGSLLDTVKERGTLVCGVNNQLPGFGVVDADGNYATVPEGGEGELLVRGPQVMKGYWNNPDAESHRLRGGWFWSGDLAYRDADGWIYFAGRTAAWLRVDGENLATAPIEQILLRHPAIDQAAVYAVPDERAGDQVAAALILRSDLGPGIKVGPGSFRVDMVRSQR